MRQVRPRPDQLAVNLWYNQLEDRGNEITKGLGFMSGVSWLFDRAIPNSQHLVFNYLNENIFRPMNLALLALCEDEGL